MRFQQKHQAAFSLVELSIVLVILGLLVGGVLSGQSLIRAAELRAVSTEYMRYVTAVQSFRDKYFAIPGDMTTATQFWGAADGSTGNTPACITAVGVGTQTCNGSGNGALNVPAYSNEPFRFWQHLANAGLIEGSLAGVQGAGGSTDAIPGYNVPVSKLGGGAFGAYYTAGEPGDSVTFAGQYTNLLVVGGISPGNMPVGRIFLSEEVWNIDTKLDDGRPGLGKVRLRYVANCSTVPLGTDLTADYRLSNRNKQCGIYFPNIM